MPFSQQLALANFSKYLRTLWRRIFLLCGQSSLNLTIPPFPENLGGMPSSVSDQNHHPISSLNLNHPGPAVFSISTRFNLVLILPAYFTYFIGQISLSSGFMMTYFNGHPTAMAFPFLQLGSFFCHNISNSFNWQILVRTSIALSTAANSFSDGALHISNH